MPIPRWVARTNRHVLNPLLRRAFGRVPPLAVIHHVGRRSGRPRATPVFAFRAPTPPRSLGEVRSLEVRVVVALTYGTDVDWLHNVETAGSFELERRGRRYVVDDLRRVTGDAGARLVPVVVRGALRVLRVDEFLVGRVRPLG
ncbi:nitroreductase family deazaflavin-dependent oxidoreductase [Oerskovia flava]|uniref:nitroreductase family deazaflavin-dependent oxidoreductase n=1 Tax=Oerskovia flava TaxID=2986422 RepID=UPI0022404B78|nr:nitroreductase family deazaflavin-dependent oxidoreductase [Oerskovia sp. JB1-3-2]